MSRGLADTSVFIADKSGRPLVADRLPDELGVSIVTVAELRAGVLAAASAASRARRLATLERALELDPVPIDDAVARAWAELRVSLRDAGQRMGVNDSWIAATAIALGISLVTQDAAIPAVAGLDVVVV